MSEYHKARWLRVMIASAFRPRAPVWGRPTYLAASVGKTGLPSTTKPLSVGFRGMLLLCHGCAMAMSQLYMLGTDNWSHNIMH